MINNSFMTKLLKLYSNTFGLLVLRNTETKKKI